MFRSQGLGAKLNTESNGVLAVPPNGTRPQPDGKGKKDLTPGGEANGQGNSTPPLPTAPLPGGFAACPSPSERDNNGLGRGGENKNCAEAKGSNSSNNNTPPQLFPGQGVEHRSEQGAAHAQNTLKNPHYTGTLPGRGLAHRSSTADQHAQNTLKNPHLQGDAQDVIVQLGKNGEHLYFHHSDHLGSVSTVTNADGKPVEHLEYFPFGETWVDQHHNVDKTSYRFTGKELDAETGMYYFGARYYEPRLSIWVSPDKALEKFIPNLLDKKQQEEGYDPAKDLAGMGGIYRPNNISMYKYASNNPLFYYDPNGNEDVEKMKAARADMVKYGMLSAGGFTTMLAGGASTIFGVGIALDVAGLTAFTAGNVGFMEALANYEDAKQATPNPPRETDLFLMVAPKDKKSQSAASAVSVGVNAIAGRGLSLPAKAVKTAATVDSQVHKPKSALNKLMDLIAPEERFNVKTAQPDL